MSILDAAVPASRCCTLMLVKNPISNLEGALAASQESNRISAESLIPMVQCSTRAALQNQIPILQAVLAAFQCSTKIRPTNSISMLKATPATSRGSNKIFVKGPISSWRAALAAFKCFHNAFCNKSNADFEGCAGGLQYSTWILIQHLILRLLRLRLHPPRCFNPPAYRPLDRVACVESCFGIFHNLGTAIVAFGVVPIRIYFLACVSICIHSYLYVSLFVSIC